MTKGVRGAVLSARRLSRVYPGEVPTHALRNATFDIEPGDFVVVAGRSGSGKTTLLSILGLLDEPTSGEYKLSGESVASMDDSRRSALLAHEVGFVFQSFHLAELRTVRENIGAGLMFTAVSRSQIGTMADAIAEQLGLSHRLGALCRSLSGGEKQRVAIGRTLIKRPSLILCDEPTGNLDSATAAQILALIRETNRNGCTTILVTHDERLRIDSDRLLTVSDGFVAE